MDNIMMNKEEWGEGPWLNEPGMDEVMFCYKSYECLLRRNDAGAWCGYVAIPAENKWAKYDNYMDIPLKVHGGITFGEYATNKKTGQEVYIIGFDCNHANDYAPRSEAINKNLHLYAPKGFADKIKELRQEMLKCLQGIPRIGKKVYRTLDYATEQLKGLVDQMEKESNGN